MISPRRAAENDGAMALDQAIRRNMMSPFWRRDARRNRASQLPAGNFSLTRVPGAACLRSACNDPEQAQNDPLGASGLCGNEHYDAAWRVVYAGSIGPWGHKERTMLRARTVQTQRPACIEAGRAARYTATRSTQIKLWVRLARLRRSSDPVASSFARDAHSPRSYT